tara:strand:- start:30254 stop:30457 length:204 start_codon:yes stop_codon:yes gene_type:complete
MGEKSPVWVSIKLELKSPLLGIRFERQSPDWVSYRLLRVSYRRTGYLNGANRRSCVSSLENGGDEGI